MRNQYVHHIYEPSVDLDVSVDKFRGDPQIHRWPGRLGCGSAAAIVMLTQVPRLAATPNKLEEAVDKPGVDKGTRFDRSKANRSLLYWLTLFLTTDELATIQVRDKFKRIR